MQFQQTTQASIKSLEMQVSQMAKEMSEMRASQEAKEMSEMRASQGSGKLPSQTINLGENASAITFRSGRQVEDPKSKAESTYSSSFHTQAETSQTPSHPIVDPPRAKNAPAMTFKEPLVFTIPAPFPSRLAKNSNDAEEKEILETFKKVQVNIPLIGAIKQVPRYAKFLKELCTNKRKLKRNEVVSVGETCLAIFQKKLPPKLQDPGSFTIPITISKTKFGKAMLDLGASINVMPYSVFTSLHLDNLKETGVVIQLADRSNAYPRGVLEDVLVQVNELVFPADFYVLDMKDEDAANPTPLLLGRPFMKTTRAKIDVFNGTLTMEFDGEVVRFNIFEAMIVLMFWMSLHNRF